MVVTVMPIVVVVIVVFKKFAIRHQDGPGDFSGVCVRVTGSDDGACMVNDDCRFGEVCVINDDGEMECADEGTTDCTTDFTVCAEGSEACLSVCEGDSVQLGVCTCAGGGGCKSSDDCRSGEACVLPDGLVTCPDNEACGECANLYACESNEDCGPGAACNLEVNTCELLGASCDIESDTDLCSANEVCDEDEGICQVLGGPCGTDADCPGSLGFCDLSTGTVSMALAAKAMMIVATLYRWVRENFAILPLVNADPDGPNATLMHITRWPECAV